MANPKRSLRPAESKHTVIRESDTEMLSAGAGPDSEPWGAIESSPTWASVQLHRQEPTGTLSVTWGVKKETDRYVVKDLVVSMDDPESEISPVTMRAISKLIDSATMEAMGFLSDVPPRTWWDQQLRSIVPADGFTKAEWVARVWRDYYEPTGRTLLELADHLGLSHRTTRSYASDFDPRKETPDA